MDILTAISSGLSGLLNFLGIADNLATQIVGTATKAQARKLMDKINAYVKSLNTDLTKLDETESKRVEAGIRGLVYQSPIGTAYRQLRNEVDKPNVDYQRKRKDLTDRLTDASSIAQSISEHRDAYNVAGNLQNAKVIGELRNETNKLINGGMKSE